MAITHEIRGLSIVKRGVLEGGVTESDASWVGGWSRLRRAVSISDGEAAGPKGIARVDLVGELVEDNRCWRNDLSKMRWLNKIRVQFRQGPKIEIANLRACPGV